MRPYVEAAPIAAFFLGVSSGFGFAMIAATLTTRLAQDGIKKSAVTAFAFTFLAFNFKWLWAPLVDTVRIPGLGRFGQRRAWLWLVGGLVMMAVVFLGSLDPKTSLMVGAPFVYQAHVTVAWLPYAVWPYTRLVHVWSVPLGYLFRSPIVYRAKRRPARTALR